ncbi:Histone deacetylase 11 [Rhizophlyctis rosea]|uniref:Histone deacetylase 11 n=1 Tax=Rhizophlyctis rosea TaxID=64517 RepID=A0AAD5SMF7_9FUNG|nr:Histone deacetylase 11 [Rhizophlyctis rosea]
MSAAGPKLPIVDSPKYNISVFGLEKLHSFDSKKYGRIFSHLTTVSKLFTHSQTHTPPTPTRNDLLKIHTPAYMDSLNDRMVLTRILEVPVVAMLPMFVSRSRILEPMLAGTGGTILAAELAMKHGWAMNLGGGYHHASGNQGSGFCVYADWALAITNVFEKFPAVKRVLYVDLDAHQGNGVARSFMEDDRVHILDAYNPHIFPADTYAKTAITYAMSLSTATLKTPTPYLSLLRTTLSHAIESSKPDLICYNAGTDCLEGDRLGAMMLTDEAVVERDEIVWRMALEKGVPVVMALSGGYQMNNAGVIARSIENLVQKLGLFDRMRHDSGIGESADSGFNG